MVFIELLGGWVGQTVSSVHVMRIMSGGVYCYDRMPYRSSGRLGGSQAMSSVRVMRKIGGGVFAAIEIEIILEVGGGQAVSSMRVMRCRELAKGNGRTSFS